ncbi:MAG: hypothetical protein WCB79_11150 [Halobacteriota archaeon]
MKRYNENPLKSGPIIADDIWGMPDWAMNDDKVEVTDMVVTDVHVSINNTFRFFSR